MMGTLCSYGLWQLVLILATIVSFGITFVISGIMVVARLMKANKGSVGLV